VAPEFVHQPDLLDEAVWRQTDDFWQYAMFAAIAYIRAAADRAGPCARYARSYPSVDSAAIRQPAQVSER
jgi:hypothetical protein